MPPPSPIHAPGTSGAHAAARVRALGRGVDRAPPGISLRAIERVNAAVQAKRAWVLPVRRAVEQSLVGQKRLVDRLLVALMAGGHVLVEGMPGLAKHVALESLAAATRTRFHGVRCTADTRLEDFFGDVEAGLPNFILADEIERVPPRVSNAILDALQTGRVTLGLRSYDLPTPFLVVFTKLPASRGGGEALARGALDRLLLHVPLDYPSPSEERDILESAAGRAARVAEPVIDRTAMLEAQEVVYRIYMDERIKDYIISLVHATRDPGHYGLDLGERLEHGASPRVTLGLVEAAKAVAFLRGRAFVAPQDVQAIWPDVVRHRIGLSDAAVAEGVDAEDVVRAIIDGVPAP